VQLINFKQARLENAALAHTPFLEAGRVTAKFDQKISQKLLR
jgi:hypothetical protein